MRAIKTLRDIWCDQSGATAIEYGLIVALVCLAILGMIQAVADETTDMWDQVSARVSAVMSP